MLADALLHHELSSVELDKWSVLNIRYLTELSFTKMLSYFPLSLEEPSLLSTFTFLHAVVYALLTVTLLLFKNLICLNRTCTSESGDSSSKARTGRAPSLHRTCCIFSAIKHKQKVLLVYPFPSPSLLWRHYLKVICTILEF